jgi:hypothetical protein
MSLRDPTGAVPMPDSTGRLALTETKGVFIGSVLSLVLACGMVTLSVWFFASLLAGRLSPDLYVRLRVVAWVALIFIPAIPWILLTLLYPTRLVIDASGITYRVAGRARRIAWAEIQGIDVRQVPVDRSGGRQTATDVRGAAGRKLIWMPVFGVAPVALAQYLSARRDGNPVPRRR